LYEFPHKEWYNCGNYTYPQKLFLVTLIMHFWWSVHPKFTSWSEPIISACWSTVFDI